MFILKELLQLPGDDVDTPGYYTAGQTEHSAEFRKTHSPSNPSNYRNDVGEVPPIEKLPDQVSESGGTPGGHPGNYQDNGKKESGLVDRADRRGTIVKKLPTLDLLEEIHKQLGYRLSLDHLAKITLGSKKSADGLQALRWWKQGKIREIIDYCRQDVRITWEIYCFGNENGYLLFQNKAGNTVRVPVSW